jgi:hypothetical protein
MIAGELGVTKMYGFRKFWYRVFIWNVKVYRNCKNFLYLFF